MLMFWSSGVIRMSVASGRTARMAPWSMSLHASGHCDGRVYADVHVSEQPVGGSTRTLLFDGLAAPTLIEAWGGDGAAVGSGTEQLNANSVTTTPASAQLSRDILRLIAGRRV